MWIRMAALAAVFVVYLSWTDETLAAKHRDKHSRLSTLPRHHSNKNAKQNITKQDYWRKLRNLEERLDGQIRKKGKNGISKRWKKKWRKAKKNLVKQYKTTFGKAPSKREKKKYRKNKKKKKDGKRGGTRKKLENGLKKRRENRKGHSSRKSTSTQSTALSNYTSPSTHRSSQHASQQQTHSHANGHTAEQPSTARNQQSTGQENDKNKEKLKCVQKKLQEVKTTLGAIKSESKSTDQFQYYADAAIGHANDLSEALDKALNVTDSDVDIAYLKKKLTALYAMTFNIEIFTENAKDPEKAKQLQQSAYRTIGDFSKTCKEDDPSCWMKLKQ